MIGGNRLSHSYRKIGKTLVRVVCPRKLLRFVHVTFTGDDDDPAITASDFYPWVGHPAADEEFE